METKAYQSFIGQGWSFPPEFNLQSREVRLSTDENDIEASLKILLGTTAGERFLRPKYGLNLQQMLFEPMNVTNLTFLKDRIRTAILVYEPRIKLITLDINVALLQQGRVEVSLEYIVRSTNSRFNLVYPYFLNDGNEVSNTLGFES
jgi:phage baseplate assembly protein W